MAGRSSAILSASGMVPEGSDKINIFVITGNSISKQFFITEVGKGPRLHDLSADFSVYSLNWKPSSGRSQENEML